MESLQEEKIRELNVDLENLQNKLTVFEETALDDKEARRENAYKLTEENSKLHSELNKVRISFSFLGSLLGSQYLSGEAFKECLNVFEVVKFLK